MASGLGVVRMGAVAGFGHQAVVALHPVDSTGVEVPPSTRHYSDATDPRFQDLRGQLENEWIAQLCGRLQIDTAALPLLWDADFLLGERTVAGAAERHVLCEINVSSVSPFPASAIEVIVEATCRVLGRSRS